MLAGQHVYNHENHQVFDAHVKDRLQAKTKASRVRLLVVAPPHAIIPGELDKVYYAPERHEALIAEMQRLRGRIYLQDGAITLGQLSRDGRHRLAIDRESWHLLAVDGTGSVCGCVRYRSHDNTACFRELWVRHSALAISSIWRSRFRAAVESELQESRRREVAFVEVGGWAIAPEFRCTTEALRTALATYGLAQSLGGCIGITTATVRHGSSSMLRRIGGRSLQDDSGEIPPYYDPQYDCQMEVLRFDSARMAARYAGSVEELRLDIHNVPVISPTPLQRSWRGPVVAHQSLWCPEPRGLQPLLQPA